MYKVCAPLNQSRLLITQRSVFQLCQVTSDPYETFKEQHDLHIASYPTFTITIRGRKKVRRKVSDSIRYNQVCMNQPVCGMLCKSTKSALLTLYKTQHAECKEV